MTLIQYNFRIDTDLKAWLSAYAKKVGVTETQVIRDLLESLRDGRLVILSQEHNPFPVSQIPVEPGSVPEYPILITQEV